MVSKAIPGIFQKIVQTDQPDTSLHIIYANGWPDDRLAELTVNGRLLTTLVFPPTDSWQSLKVLACQLDLPIGAHDLMVRSKNNAGPDIRDIALASHEEGVGRRLSDIGGAVDDATLLAATILISGTAAIAAGGEGNNGKAPLAETAKAGLAPAQTNQIPDAPTETVAPPITPAASTDAAVTMSEDVSESLDRNGIATGTVAQPVAPLALALAIDGDDGQPATPAIDPPSNSDDANGPTEANNETPDNPEQAPAASEDTMAFPIVFQETEFTIIDADEETLARDVNSPEQNATSDPTQFTAQGLRPGYSGDGYLDFGGGAGAKFQITVAESDLDGSGVYSLVIKLANGGTGANIERPLQVYSGDTLLLEIANTNTGSFAIWETLHFDIELPNTGEDHVLTFHQAGAQGPNIDAIAIVAAGQTHSFLDPVFEPAPEFVVVEGETAVGSVLAEDADGQAVTYAITGGDDLDLFTIDAETGVISFIEAPVYSPTSAAGYSVEVTATDEAGASAVQMLTVVVQEYFEQILVEAETGTIYRNDEIIPASQMMIQNGPLDEGASGVDEFNLRPNYSGSGYLDFGSTGEGVRYVINSPVAGTFDLHIRYSSTGTRNAQVLIGDEVVATLAFTDTATNTTTPSNAFNNWAVMTTQVTLVEGQNEIALFLHDGVGPNVDALAITGLNQQPDFAPRFNIPGDFALDENQTEIGSVDASDVLSDTRPGGTPGAVTYSITGGPDAAMVQIDAATGLLSLMTAADYEVKQSYEVEVTATDSAGNGTVQTVTISVNDVDEAPSAPVFNGLSSFGEDIAPGSVLGSLISVDPEGQAITFTTSDDRFVVVGNQLVVAQDAVFDGAEAVSLTVTATDGTHSVTSDFAIEVTAVEDVEEPPVYTSLDVVFDENTLASYAGLQDGGSNYAVADDGATLQLNDNHWKRAPLGTSYTITNSTVISVDVANGAFMAELVAIGFDLNNDPLDRDGSIYLLDGTDNNARFVNLKGTGTDLGNGVFRYEIDLSAHAGKVIDSLVFIADDDSPTRDGLGSVSFTNVKLLESGLEPGDNAAPIILAGGIVDMATTEGSMLEVDLPFLDPEGEALSYSLLVTDASGADVTALFGDLSFVDGALIGTLPKLPGVYTVTVTADDGAASNATTSDSFTLTVQNVNDAPEVADVVLEPYFGAINEPIDPIDISDLAYLFSDPDGDSLTISINPATLPDGLSFNAETQQIVGTPTVGGTHQIQVIATDPQGLTATLLIEIGIDAPEVGDTYVIEAEHFTGLAEATEFFTAVAPGASGNLLIRTNADVEGSVQTDLSAGGVPPGWYKVAITIYDETDGNASFSIDVGGVNIADGAHFDDPGVWLNGNGTSGRGTAGQVGNRKMISFDQVVYIEAGTLLTINGTADQENLRIDSLTLTRAEPAELPPSSPQLDNATVAENAAGAVIGILSSVDPDGGAVVFTTEDARFVIDGNTLRLADGVALDHEAGAVVSVEVTATDSDGMTSTVVLNIAVEDVNEAPVLAAGAAIDDLVLDAGQAGSVDLAAALAAVDPDAGNTVSYVAQLAGGAPLPEGISVVDGQLVVAGTLPQGLYTIEAFATDGVLDSDSVLFTVAVGEAAPFQPFVLQAEDAQISLSDNPDGNATITTVRDPDNPETGSFSGLRPDFMGSGYVDYGDDAGDTLSFAINVPEPGEYIIKIRYASQDFDGAARSLDLSVNGAAGVTTVFPSTGPSVSGPEAGFNNWQELSVTVTLNAGENSFALAIPAGTTTGPNVDQITITTAAFEDVSADADDQPLFLSGPDGPLSPTQAASINFNLAGIDSDIIKVEVSFDGGMTRIEVFPDADGDFVIDGSHLSGGSHTAMAYVTDANGNQASSGMPIIVAAPDVADFTIQAEDTAFVTVDDEGVPANGDFTRVVDAQNPDAFGNFRAGAVGNSYIDFGTDPGDAVVLTFDAAAAGTYQVQIRYANGGTANRPLDMSVNGGTATSVDFPAGTALVPWEEWLIQTVEVELAAGSNQIRLAVPAGADNGPNLDQFTFSYLEDDGTVAPFEITIEGETFTINDIETVPGTPADTVHRTAANPEPGASNNTTGLYDSNGLRYGYEGAGYLDMGADIGDSAGFNVDVPVSGVYQLVVRYANGGATDRPLTLTINGVEQVINFPPAVVTGDADPWAVWSDVTVDVQLQAGSNAISFTNTIANGPNIDNVTISRAGSDVETRDIIRFEEVVKINFEPAPGQVQSGLPGGYQTPDGYLADTGAAFGDRGNGFSYGWVTEASVADGTANGVIPADQPANAHWYKNDVAGASDLQKTYAHFEYPGAGASGSRAWEMELENGTYQITMSVGDTAGAFDSNYVINIEGQNVMPTWVPANPIDGSTAGGGFRSTLVTTVVTVTDGRLTIDSIGGTNTEIQHLQVERIPDLTPDDDRTADLDYSFFVAPVAATIDGQTSISIGENGELPTGIDPTASFVIGVNLQAPGNRGPNIAHVENIKLVETLTGIEVPIDVQISGGADSMTIRPLGDLKENTSYTLKVQDVIDLGSVEDASAPLRQFQNLTTTFVTGEMPENVAREVAFETTMLLNGYSDGATGYTTIEFGPDGKLYVATITGEVHRWSVNSDGSINKASQETLSLDYLDAGNAGRRGIVGFAFDPNDPNTIWITDNAPIPRESKAFNTPEFSGRLSKITLGEDGSFDGASAETFAFGLPRSGGDHLTNSVEFRLNPAWGAAGEPEYLLYISQGSNSAGGAPDSAWGNRPERLLNAAILEVDISKQPPAGGFDVRTEPISLTDSPTTSFPADAFNADGTYPGMYNPYADDAVIKIYATGVRNAYDLVWHSNGNLYVPTNGTASGARTPQDPTQPFDEGIKNSPKQYDYLFTVEEGKYYGHPVELRGEYILNGGNPTSGLDPNEVVGGNDGNSSTDGYPVGVQPDPNYDLDGVYNLGYNRSPNGAVEYTGNAFGSNLKGAILVAQFSTGDNVRYLLVNEAGEIIGDDVLRRPDGSIIDDYIDPLDIIENPLTGQLYLMTLNRSTGASQVVLLTPAPGGVTQDITADEGGDLALIAFDVSDPSAAIFQINGLDDDITAIRISFGGGLETTVTLDNNNRFVIDLGAMEGETTATIEVTDDALNHASASVTFVPGEEPQQPDFVPLITIQAEDRTGTNGATVTIANSLDAEIMIRDSLNPETGTSGLVNGLRPGAFGMDGNTDNYDGVPGGYADFGATNADFITFTFDVSASDAGSAILRFRYANGGTTDRPLQVEVNGTIITVEPFVPTTAATTDASWSNWQYVEIPANLVAGSNSVTLRAVANTGPNIDQLEVLVSSANGSNPGDGLEVVDGVNYVIYEAENASLGGAAIVTENRTQSGDFVDFIGTADQTVTWTVQVGEAGLYGLDLIYALGSGKAARPMQLSVNGVPVETLPFLSNSNAGETVWGPQAALVTLLQGTNTISITAPGGNGPNLDYLRVTQQAIDPFVPIPAEIDGSGRIELEATDGSANTVNGSEVVFYFTVSKDGVYQLATAVNAGAPAGQGLNWFINGEEVGETRFPGTQGVNEEAVFLSLEAGTTYELRITSDAPGASQLDYLDVSPSTGNPNADIVVTSLEPGFFEDRLHFSYLENPVQNGVTRDDKDSGVVRISNSGTEPLNIEDVQLSGPFTITSPASLEGMSIAPGGFIDVTVAFDRAAYTPPTTAIDATSTVFEGVLRIRSDDADQPITDIDLAGFWQSVPEGGMEPNVNEVWRIFGFGNQIEGLKLTGGGENSVLSTFDVFAKTHETEVLSPFWKLADGVTEAKITQIAAFHGPSGATMGIHNPANKGQGVTFWNHDGSDNQRLLPNSGGDNSYSTATFTGAQINANWAGDGVFGINVAGLSSDPRQNPTGGVVVPGEQQGHTVKIFQALDAKGNVIPNVYLGVMDYTGINYDYNDNMFIIEGVQPAGFGQSLEVVGLDDAAADDRLVFTSIDNPANSEQKFRNEAVVTLSNDGFSALEIAQITVGDPANFQIVGPIPTSIAAGASVDLTVRFIGEHPGNSAGATIHKSTLTVVSDDPSQPSKVIQLAGIAQNFSESGSEPTVSQIVEAFGYSTDMAEGQLANGGQVETIGDEVLMPYMQALDPSRGVEVIQLAAFLQLNNVARLGMHSLQSADMNELFAQDDQQAQTVLPDGLVYGPGDTGGTARATINSDDPFGLYIWVDNRPTYASWSDPEANKIDPDFGHMVGDNQGHLIRFFQALDANGQVIEGTYIAIQDYPGAGNYDYNDHMFIIKNVQPYALTDQDDANGDGVNDALQLDGDNDGTVDFFDPDTTEVPADGKGAYVLGVNIGGNAIALDPVLGVALVGQGDPRVTITGSVTPWAGVDAATDPNGQNATPGSAFMTYEDGTNWTTSIAVENGTYVLTLWTQETYWNSSGMRQFDATVNGQQVIANLDPFAEVGPDTPYGVETIVTVTNGKIDINMVADIDNAALNAVTIHEYVVPMAEEGQTPFHGFAFAIADDLIVIDASDYDEGGQGVAYYDASPGLQGGTNGGRVGSSVEQTDAGNIGWIQNGEWLEYTLNVAEAGLYDIGFLTSFGGSGARSIEASFRKGGQVYEATGAVTVDPTASWTSFEPTETTQVQLEAGLQVMRVAFTGGSMDLASISLTPSDAMPFALMMADGPAVAKMQPADVVIPSDDWPDHAAIAHDDLDGIDDAPNQFGGVFGHDLLA